MSAWLTAEEVVAAEQARVDRERRIANAWRVLVGEPVEVRGEATR